MKLIFGCLLGAALCVGVGILLRAQEFGPERTRGKVLLLKNGHAMEGDVEKVGAQMCVRRGSSEVWIGNDKAARLCADWDEAFRYVESMIRPADANDRVKLARWCQLNKLSDRALEQARRALQLQPDHADAKQLVTMLERAQKAPAAKPVTSAPPPKPAAPVEPPPSVDVTAETLVTFITRVQPILMNTCASCHATGNGGAFVLERVNDNSSRAASQRNLAAVLEQIDLDRPAISPLLERAIRPHGSETRAPLPSRSAKAFQSMHHWLEVTIAKNPQLKDYRAVKRKPSMPVPTAPATLNAEPPLPQPSVIRGVAAPAVPVRPAPEPATTPAPPTPTPLTPTPAVTGEPDAYDVEPFNRHFHAERLKSKAF